MSAPRKKTRSSGPIEPFHDPVEALDDLADTAAHMSWRSLHQTSIRETFGGPHSYRRQLIALTVAFVAATLVRQLCFLSFRKDLQANLAPVERDNVEWTLIGAVRLLDLVIALPIWQHSGRAVDPPALGIILTLISRPYIYFFVQHHFLVSTRTAVEVLTTDVVSYGFAIWIIAKVAPRGPIFQRQAQPIKFLRSLSRDDHTSVGLALLLGTLLSGLLVFVSGPLGLQKVIRSGVEKRIVPAFLAPSKYGFSLASRHPSLPIPVLRSDLEYVTMYQAFCCSLPSSLALTALALFVLPQAPVSTLAVIAGLLCAPQTALYLHNVLPFRMSAASLVGLDSGFRAALVSATISWVLADVRQPPRSVQRRSTS